MGIRMKVRLSLSHICCLSLRTAAHRAAAEGNTSECVVFQASCHPATATGALFLCLATAGGLFWSCWDARDAQQHLEQALGQSSSKVLLKFQLWNELFLFSSVLSHSSRPMIFFFNSPKIVLLKSLYEAVIATLGAQDAIRGDNRCLLTPEWMCSRRNFFSDCCVNCVSVIETPWHGGSL